MGKGLVPDSPAPKTERSVNPEYPVPPTETPDCNCKSMEGISSERMNVSIVESASMQERGMSLV